MGRYTGKSKRVQESIGLIWAIILIALMITAFLLVATTGVLPDSIANANIVSQMESGSGFIVIMLIVGIFTIAFGFFEHQRKRR